MFVSENRLAYTFGKVNQFSVVDFQLRGYGLTKLGRLLS